MVNARDEDGRWLLRDALEIEGNLLLAAARLVRRQLLWLIWSCSRHRPRARELSMLMGNDQKHLSCQHLMINRVSGECNCDFNFGKSRAGLTNHDR